LNASLAQHFEELELQRNRLLERIYPLSTDQLNAHPPGKWSIAQVLSHIIASEQLSVRYINKKYLGINESPNTGLREDIKMIVLIISQRLPFKFKAPNVVVEKTTAYQSAEELKQVWDKTREEMKEMLKHFKEEDLKRRIYKHPIAGMLNITQAVRFFLEHIIHHTPQITRLLSQK
jgi:uncharacterized damage-inducible protein DinB